MAYQDARTSPGWVAKIARLGRAMNDARSSVDVAEFVAEEVRFAMDAASVSISRWDPIAGQVHTLINVGDLAPWEQRRPTDESYDFSVLSDVGAAGGVSVFDRDDPDCRPKEADLLDQLGKRVALVTVIRHGGRAWGELYVTRRADQPKFSPEEIEAAEGVAGFVSMAFAQADWAQFVTRMAFEDALTGLKNRRAVDQVLDDAFDAHQADGTAVALVLCDVNGLKQVNDTLGHEAGDRLLTGIARVLEMTVAAIPGALAGRLGGDEFCVVLRGESAADAAAIADELHLRAGSVTGGTGVSCGVASTTSPGLDVVDTPERLLRLADAAQYRAKRTHATTPVVAGKFADPDALSGSVGLGGRSGGRRRLRDDRSVDPGKLAEGALEAIDLDDGTLACRRMSVLGEAVARLLDAAAWYVTTGAEGARVLVTIDGSSDRPTDKAPTWDEQGLVGAEWDLDSYPLTESVLAGGAFLLHRDDPTGDPAELDVLSASGYDAVLLAGGTDVDGRGWLLEVFADELTGELAGLAPTMRALVASALLGMGGGVIAGQRGRDDENAHSDTGELRRGSWPSAIALPRNG